MTSTATIPNLYKFSLTILQPLIPSLARVDRQSGASLDSTLLRALGTVAPSPPGSFPCNPKGPGSSCRDDAPFPQCVFLASAPPLPHLFPSVMPPDDTGSRHSHGTSSTSGLSNELPTRIVPVVSQFVHHGNVRFRYNSTLTTLYYLSSRIIFAALHRRFTHKSFVPFSYRKTRADSATV